MMPAGVAVCRMFSINETRSSGSNGRCSCDAIKLFGGQYFSSVVLTVIVPNKRLRDMVVHTEIEVGHDDDGRLEAFGQIESIGGHLETLFWGSRKEQRMFRITMRSISREQNVRLLRPRRHSGRRAGALNVDKHRRNLGEIAEAKELVHQGNARAACGGE